MYEQAAGARERIRAGLHPQPGLHAPRHQIAQRLPLELHDRQGQPKTVKESFYSP